MKAQNIEMSGRLGTGLNQISQLDSDLGNINNELKATSHLGTFSVLSLASPMSHRSFLIGRFLIGQNEGRE